jgi:hypothetical protein
MYGRVAELRSTRCVEVVFHLIMAMKALNWRLVHSSRFGLSFVCCHLMLDSSWDKSLVLNYLAGFVYHSSLRQYSLPSNTRKCLVRRRPRASKFSFLLCGMLRHTFRLDPHILIGIFPKFRREILLPLLCHKASLLSVIVNIMLFIVVGFPCRRWKSRIAFWFC